jgi:restriction endonuclease S subunit
MGTVGKTALINFEKEFVVLSSLAIVSPNLQKSIPNYLYHVMSTDWFINKAISEKTGVAIKRIVLKTLKTIKVPLPDLETQRQIVSQIEKEQALVKASKQLIEIFEQKIKDRIAKVWVEIKMYRCNMRRMTGLRWRQTK